MRKNRISINQLQNGKYQVSYRDPRTNKRVRKRFDTFKEARKFERDQNVLFENVNNEALQVLTVKELMQIHLEKVPSSRADERKYAFESFLKTFGDTEIKHLSTTEVKNWMDRLKVELDYTESTMASIKGSLNHFFNFLVDEGIIGISPLSKYKIRRNLPPRKPRVFMTENEIRVILDQAKKISPTFLYPYLLALAHTGARRMEIVNLEWSDVDFTNNLLYLRDVKFGNNRPVKMSKQLRKLIEEQPRTCKKVFTNPEGEEIGRSQLFRHLQSFKASYPFTQDFNFHAFRHSFAYNFLKKGGQMYELMAVLGHKTITLTINLYGQIRSQDVEDPSPYDF
ncbi:MAG: site-specific integrase [Bdellovibrionota bacterium]|nr:site-specific integrase [Bdellovibrionota bacterium]